MRKIMISLLLASAAASPALAARPPERGGDGWRGSQSDASQSQRSDSDRSERPSFEERRSEPREQPRFEPREQSAPRTMTSDPGWSRRGPDDNSLHAGRDPRAGFARSNPGESIDQVQQRVDRREQSVREGGWRTDPGAQVSGGSARRWVRDGGGPPPVVSDVPQPGTQPRLRTGGRRTPSVQWNGGWRGDSRYNWQDQRRRHRSIFHVGAYYDPFGWGYQPFQIGWRMWPNYYGSRYWINDPAMYRLPYAPPGYRWIRYWDDAILVDTWSGEVVDVIPNFFW